MSVAVALGFESLRKGTPGRYFHERGSFATHIVKIQVNTTEMCKNKVADRVCALDWLGVVCEGIKEPRVLGGYEGVRLLVGPKLSAVLALPPSPVQS